MEWYGTVATLALPVRLHQKIYPDDSTIRVQLVLVSTGNIEIWNLVKYNLFSAYLARIKGVEVFTVFFEAGITM